VTRYFMTVEEAVELVIQAGAIGRAGEALVLDMGAPVRIAEVAQRMAAQAKRPTHVVYTGLRTGEKLHEVLLGAREADERPIQPAISHVSVPTLDPLDVRTLDPWVPTSELIETMRYLCVDEVVHGSSHGSYLPSKSRTAKRAPERGVGVPGPDDLYASRSMRPGPLASSVSGGTPTSQVQASMVWAWAAARRPRR
jgi:hypothetical protein